MIQAATIAMAIKSKCSVTGINVDKTASTQQTAAPVLSGLNFSTTPEIKVGMP